MILSAITGSNDEIFKDIISLYCPKGFKIADVTYGNGVFWKQVNIAYYNLIKSDLNNGTDFRNLPYKDEEFDCVILDPPYIYNPSNTIKKSISNSYNNNITDGLKSNNDVLRLYDDGIKEIKRILKIKGILIIKCQDIIESGKNKWNHIEIYELAMNRGFFAEDLFVLVQKTIPCKRWDRQLHARKNHSYFWVFRRKI